MQTFTQGLSSSRGGHLDSSPTALSRFGRGFEVRSSFRSSPGLASDRRRSKTEGVGAAGNPILHDFGKVRMTPVPASVSGGAAFSDLPSRSPDPDFDDQALTPTPSETPSITTFGDSCAQPRSMNKVTSGSFLGGLTIDDYFPDIASRGYPSTAGPFDVGGRAGANIQLYGVVPSPCEPGQFHLEQTVTRTRFRVDGEVHEREGEHADDIAKSGRDASAPPFRQEFLGGSGAPFGFIISMADPPSTRYTAGQDIEHDRDFVTSLVGSGGRRSVRWSLSTRISGGTVTSNVLT